MIKGVTVKQLKPICDERGRVMEIMRSDWTEFKTFGQVYMTTVYPQAVKAWHYHKKQTDSIVCLKGMLKLVVYDSRPGSATKGEVNEFFIGEHNPAIVQVPPMIYHGFKCVSNDEAVVVNVPTHVYNYSMPDEYRLPFNTKKIPYNWDRKNR